jgi:O-antigen/teichoic acid export membrane protein
VNELQRSLGNGTLRAATIGLKFLTLLLLARWLTPTQYALFGLFAATVSYALYLVGMDFYGYSIRQLLARPPEQRGWIIKQHLCAVGAFALLGTPLLALLLLYLPALRAHLPWLLAILLFEHFAQECVRILVAAGQPLRAGVVQFLRTAAWGPPLLVLLAVGAAPLALDSVYLAWCSGGALGLLYALAALRALPVGGWRRPLDTGWIRRGLRVAVPLLLATLALRAFFTLDRYALEWLRGAEELAAYTLFATLAGGVIALADAVFNVFTYPALIAAHTAGDGPRFARELRAFALRITLFAALAAIALQLAAPLLFAVLPDPAYRQHAALLPWVLGAAVCYLLSTVPHYGLFARGRDREILAANVAALVGALATGLPLAVLAPYAAIPGAVLAGFFLLLLLKAVLLRRAGGASSRADLVMN